MNAEIIQIIANKKHPDLHFNHTELGTEIQTFLTEHCGDKITAAGKNFQGFDKLFLDELFVPKLRFHHRCFEPTTSFYQKGDKTLPDLTTCLKRANINLPFKIHTAIDDSKAVIALLRHIHKAN